jgi:hypothetical protein
MQEVPRQDQKGARGLYETLQAIPKKGQTTQTITMYDIINGKDASYLGKSSRATLGDWTLGILAVAGIALLGYAILVVFS